LKKGVHTVTVQKRTEAEQGRTTLYGIETDGLLPDAPAAPGRHIEFIGDSHTCGYGTEGLAPDEPFTPDTENCNLAWGCIAARYFDADYTLIAHSGQGMVRNWGDGKAASEITMRDRMMRTFDMEPEPLWDFTKSAYTPDIVVIKLGTNDFSTDISPSQQIFNTAYAITLRQLREAYGKVPVLCVAPADCPEIWGYLQDFQRELQDPDLHITAMMAGITNRTSDMGANFHPNHTGQRKFAMAIIPYISTITGWDLPADNVLN
jgi:lysophospholipase L1-like esterase